MPFAMDEAVDQLSRLYKYTGVNLYLCLITGNTSNQLVSAIDTGTDTFTSNAHNLINNCRVQITTSGTMPTPLVASTTYYVKGATTNTFQLSSTLGGAAIDITGVGTGAISVVEQPLDNKQDSWPIWARLEANYNGSGRQSLNYSSSTPVPDPTNNRAYLPDLQPAIKPTSGSITYRYLAIVAEGNSSRLDSTGRLRWVQDFVVSQTIVSGFNQIFSLIPDVLLDS